MIRAIKNQLNLNLIKIQSSIDEGEYCILKHFERHFLDKIFSMKHLAGFTKSFDTSSKIFI